MFKVKCPIVKEPLFKVTSDGDEKECKKRVNKVIDDDDDEKNLNEQLPIISDAQVVDLERYILIKKIKALLSQAFKIKKVL